MKDTLLKDYNTELNYDGIDGKRLAERLDAISKIGVLQTGGVSRPGFSKEEKDLWQSIIKSKSKPLPGSRSQHGKMNAW